jgi:hypothetical protein
MCYMYTALLGSCSHRKLSKSVRTLSILTGTLFKMRLRVVGRHAARDRSIRSADGDGYAVANPLRDVVQTENIRPTQLVA